VFPQCILSCLLDFAVHGFDTKLVALKGRHIAFRNDVFSNPRA
jgi:hypothetical protein